LNTADTVCKISQAVCLNFLRRWPLQQLRPMYFIRPASRGRQLGYSPKKIFKYMFVVRYNNKLESFSPPPEISAGCGRVFQWYELQTESRYLTHASKHKLNLAAYWLLTPFSSLLRNLTSYCEYVRTSISDTFLFYHERNSFHQKLCHFSLTTPYINKLTCGQHFLFLSFVQIYVLHLRLFCIDTHCCFPAITNLYFRSESPLFSTKLCRRICIFCSIRVLFMVNLL